jgi:hypothetical protein
MKTKSPKVGGVIASQVIEFNPVHEWKAIPIIFATDSGIVIDVNPVQ